MSEILFFVANKFFTFIDFKFVRICNAWKRAFLVCFKVRKNNLLLLVIHFFRFDFASTLFSFNYIILQRNKLFRAEKSGNKKIRELNENFIIIFGQDLI
jgi:hypothetical protein